MGCRMDTTRIPQLSKRHRECLRLVRDLGGSKDIAIQLGITKNTVDSYLREAVAILGASNRRQAALGFARFEATQTSSHETPHRIAGDSTWVDAAVQNTAIPVASSNAATEAPSGFANGATAPPTSRLLPLPFRAKGSQSNDLTSTQRLIWILIGALVAALILAATVNIADALIRVAKSATS
jgi:DNA-binding CsgD family transcriptional regulator